MLLIVQLKTRDYPSIILSHYINIINDNVKVKKSSHDYGITQGMLLYRAGPINYGHITLCNV